MPTIISHAVVAAAAGKVLGAKRRVLVWGALLSMLPDIDVVWFSFGMRYHDMLGHRGFTHSLLFALFAAIAVTAVATRNVPRYTPGWFGTLAFLFVCAASHGVLDAMTNGGSGIPFFFPFDNTRHFLLWRPIEVSPIGRNFFSARGADTLLNEICVLWLPCAALLGISFLMRKWMRRNTSHNARTTLTL